MNNVVLYTLPTCGKCKVLKNKMREKGIDFLEVSEFEYLATKEIDAVPVLEINGDRLDFIEANSWINQQ